MPSGQGLSASAQGGRGQVSAAFCKRVTDSRSGAPAAGRGRQRLALSRRGLRTATAKVRAADAPTTRNLARPYRWENFTRVGEKPRRISPQRVKSSATSRPLHGAQSYSKPGATGGTMKSER